MLSFSRCNIFVIGDIMLDRYFDGIVERLSPEAPVPVVGIRNQRSVLGGAANTANNLACLGCRVTLAGVRGRDAAGERLSVLLREKGIKSCLVVADDRPTICKTRVIALGQQLIRLDSEDTGDLPNATLAKLSCEIIRQLPSMSAVILSDYGKGVLRRFADGNSLPAQIIAACRQQGIPVLVDPKGKDWGRYTHADCVTPNTREHYCPGKANGNRLFS